MTDVTVVTVTKNASVDEYTEDDYRDMYAELRDNHSLAEFIALVGSQYSKGLWSKWENGTGKLNRQMRSELRRGVSLPELPPTVADAVSVAGEDAEVVQVGDGTPDRIIMASSKSEPMTIHLNGGVTATVAQAIAPERHVTTVTRPRRASIKLDVDIFDKLNKARQGRDLQWAEFLAELLPDDAE